jgi:hypothetical protein
MKIDRHGCPGALVALILLAFLCGSAGAQDCVRYDEYVILNEVPTFASGLVDIAVADGYAYVAHGPEYGIYTVSLADPRHPEFLDVIINGRTFDLLLAGQDRLCMAGSSSLRVYDVSVPGTPTLYGTLSVDEGVVDLAWYGTGLLVLWSDGTLRLADLSGPGPFDWIHEGRVAETAHSLAVVGDVVYVGGGGFDLGDGETWQGAAAVLIGEPDDPLSADAVVSVSEGDVKDLAYDGTHLWSCGAEVRGHSLVDPLAPVQVAEIVRTGVRLAVDGGILHVATGNAGLFSYDVSDPDAPVQIAHRVMEGSVRIVAAADDRMVFGGGTFGAYSAAGTNFAAPVPMYQAETVAEYWRAAPRGEYVLALSAECRFDVLDPSMPPDMIPRASLPLYCSAAIDVLVSDEACVIPTYDGWLHIVNLTDPLAPSASLQQLGCIYIHCAALSGTTLLLGGDAGVAVWDVSNPGNPHAIGNVPTIGYSRAWTAAAHGDLAVLCMQTNGYDYDLLLVDISDPTDPLVLDTYGIGTSAADIVFAGDRLYVTRGHSLEILRGIQTGELILLNRLDLDGAAGHLAVRGARGYLSCESELLVLDMSTSSLPVLLARIDCGQNWPVRLPDGGMMTIVSGGTLQVLYPDCDVEVSNEPVQPPALPDAIPRRAAIESAAPNPFNPQVRIGYALDRPGRVTVTVHDLLGRAVCTLVDRVEPAGRHAATWTGHDDAGRACPAGTYLVRLVRGDRTDSRKIQLVR